MLAELWGGGSWAVVEAAVQVERTAQELEVMLQPWGRGKGTDDVGLGIGGHVLDALHPGVPHVAGPEERLPLGKANKNGREVKVLKVQ